MDYVYILRCGDGSLYTGWTNDIHRRLLAHQSGHGARYTASHLPVELVYLEVCGSKQEAMHREWTIKQLPRAKKLSLIEGQTSPYSYRETPGLARQREEDTKNTETAETTRTTETADRIA